MLGFFFSYISYQQCVLNQVSLGGATLLIFPIKMIESQWTNFSKSPELPEDLRFLFVRIFLRIEHAYLGCGSIHQNGSKWPNYQIGEL